jgi:hypothetical protein
MTASQTFYSSLDLLQRFLRVQIVGYRAAGK